MPNQSEGKVLCNVVFSQFWPNIALYICGKRSELFSFMTFGLELMKNDSINRLFLKSFSNATILVLNQFMQCSNSKLR